MPIANAAVGDHTFLEDLVDDSYYPPPLVEKLKQILLRVCERIEVEQPKDGAAVLVITHAATEEINALQDEFFAQESEIETVARDAIGTDVIFILQAYGFADVNVEDAIAPRDW